jgi:two-component system OmpR family response regulator
MERRTILVVDDHAPTREAYASFLLDCGYRVVEAGHGGEAILHIHRQRPHAVLMDILMPGLDGVETALSLRERMPGAHMPLIAVTASQSVVETGRLHALFDAVLLKPCAPDVIASCVRSVMDAVA